MYVYICFFSKTMRIRKRLGPSSTPATALSDLQLHQSEAAAPPSDQPSDPPKQPFMAVRRWVLPENDKTEEKMKQKEFGDDDEKWRLEEKKNNNNDIRKIVSICNGVEGADKIQLPAQGDYKVIPLKKRRGSFERNPKEEAIMISGEMKCKTNKKCGDHMMGVDDQKIEENGINSFSWNGDGKKKKRQRGNAIMEGSRCSRINGRGWRCCQPTLVGYSLCEHHLGKGRLRSMAATTVHRGNLGGAPPPPQPSSGEYSIQQQPLMVTKKRTKVGVVKARSMSSLLSQI